MKLLNSLNPFYWPWLLDLIIAIASLASIVYFASLAVSDPNSFDYWASIISIFPFIYSTNSALSKRNEDRKQRDLFTRSVGPFLSDCRNLLEIHWPNFLTELSLVENKLVDTHIDDWKKYGNIQALEYKLLETWLNNIASIEQMEAGDKLLLKYTLITSSFAYHFPQLVSDVKGGNFYAVGTPHNIFARKLHSFIKESKPLNEIDLPDLTDAEIEETLNIALNTNFSFINDLLKEKENRRKIEYLLNKCFENAYTNAGNLNIELADDDARKLIFLYKYDERFSILKRILRQAIRDYTTGKTTVNTEEQIETAYQKLEQIMYPLPLSKALTDFDFCIEKLSDREKFAYVIYPEKFPSDALGWSSERFMTNRVLPKAQIHQNEFNKKLVREFPYLKTYQKKVLDANYYMFEFNRKKFSYHASQDAIPDAIKRFLIKEILDTESAGDVVASQLIYLKQFINNLSISGLLFTEEKAVQERIRKLEKDIKRATKKQGLVFSNIYDFASIGNQLDIFAAILHSALYGKTLKRKSGKQYKESLRIATTIVKNAHEIIAVFNSIKDQENITA